MAVVFTVIIVVVVGLWAWRRNRKPVSGYRSWYDSRWKKIDREQRRRIVRAVRQGRAVDDPRDAPLALEFIDAQKQLTDETRGVSRWNIRLHYLLLASVAVWIALARPDLKLIAFSLGPLAYLLTIRFVAHRLRARIASARKKNEQLIGRFS